MVPDFEISFHRAILRLCMVDEAFCARAIEHVQSDFFKTPVHGWIFTLFRNYWTEYRMRCTDLPLRQAVAYLPPDKQPLYASEVEQIIVLGTVPESDWVKHELKDFVKSSLFFRAYQDAAVLVNASTSPGDPKRTEAYDLAMAAMEKIQSVSFDTPDRQWYFEELGERQKLRYREQIQSASGISTGIPSLDDATDGGVRPGEVWAMFAQAKRCKTTWLINQGFNATRISRKPTIHFVLEGRGEQIAARYDACFSGELYSNVKRGDIASGLFMSMQEEYARLRKMLVIRTMNDWDVNVLHLEAELQTLKAQGFVPEACILDYMDLGRSRSRVDSETQHQVAFARDFKRLTLNHDLCSWSAWQAQRPKKGANNQEHILTSADVADAYAKVRIVDAFGSLNATDDEMAKGEMRVFMEGHRDAPVNKIYLIRNDLARMKMLQSVVEYVPPSSAAPPKNEFADE